MKKICSLLMAIVMMFSVFATGFINASANTMATANPVSEGQVYSTSVCGTIDKYVKSWIRFDCNRTDYYEFTCAGLTAPDGDMQITVYDSLNNIINLAVNTTGASSFSAVTYLNAGSSYYFCVEIDGTLYNLDVSLNRHFHSYTSSQQIKAVADDDAENRKYGFTRIACASCGVYYDANVRAYPATVILSNEKFTYDETGKYPAVTVYDINGGIIPASEYVVAYEDNVLPGKAFVIVTFNSAYYEGEITKSFYIIPKKQSITSLSSKKSKSITVKWTKDNNASGYELQYSTSPKFYKSKTKTIDVTKKSAVSKTINNLQRNKKYYVRVRSYKIVGYERLYSSWGTMEGKKYIKTKK